MKDFVQNQGIIGDFDLLVDMYSSKICKTIEIWNKKLLKSPLDIYSEAPESKKS